MPPKKTQERVNCRRGCYPAEHTEEESCLFCYSAQSLFFIRPIYSSSLNQFMKKIYLGNLPIMERY